MFGVQKVSPACCALAIARPSVPIASPIALKRLLLNDAAVRITCGNEVALGVGGANLTAGAVPTPWRASDHH
jgi:hypothetical protein